MIICDIMILNFNFDDYILYEFMKCDNWAHIDMYRRGDGMPWGSPLCSQRNEWYVQISMVM